MEIDDEDSDVEMGGELQDTQTLITSEDYELRLARPDSVLDDNFINIVKEYAALKSEGNKDEFINYVKEGVLLAASNYKGYTKMCNLLVDWMKEFHHPKTIHNIFMEEVKKAIIQLKPHESPTIIDNAIREAMSNCGDLPMATSSQKILNVNKFDKRLQKYVSDILSRDNEKDYREDVNRFCDFCCKNELYYLRARRSLCEWRRSHSQTAFDFALSQLEFQLDGHAKNYSTKISDLSTWAIGISPSSVIRTASLQLQRNGTITVADLSKIYDLCQEHELNQSRSQLFKRLEENEGRRRGGRGRGGGEEEEEEEERENEDKMYRRKEMSDDDNKGADSEQFQIITDFLQQPLMIDFLYNGIFKPPIHVLSRQILQKYIYLLAYSLCHSDETRRNELINDLTNISIQICHDKNYDVSLFSHVHKQNLLFDSIEKSPLLSKGIIIWIRYCVIEKEGYFNSTYEGYFTSLFLSLLANIVKKYSFLRRSVAELMDEMISIPKGLKALKEMEILQKLLDMLIFVLQHGEYKTVLEIMSSNHVSKLDRTLLRHFIHRIISTISPPVPSDFFYRLFEFFRHENIMNAIRNDHAMKTDLLAFVENIRTKQMMTFSDKIKQVIEMIKSDT